jgi:hypothetical protein
VFSVELCEGVKESMYVPHSIHIYQGVDVSNTIYLGGVQELNHFRVMYSGGDNDLNSSMYYRELVWCG